MDNRELGRSNKSVATSLLVFSIFFRNSHLVPSFLGLLASFDFIWLADGVLAFTNELIELSETHVVVEVGVSTAEGSEHLFEADIFVVVSVENTEKALGHTFLGEALS